MHTNTAVLFNSTVYSDTDKIIITKNVSFNFLIRLLIGGSAQSIKGSWEERRAGLFIPGENGKWKVRCL